MKYLRVRVTKPEIRIERDPKVRDAIAFRTRLIPGRYVYARILRIRRAA